MIKENISEKMEILKFHRRQLVFSFFVSVTMFLLFLALCIMAVIQVLRGEWSTTALIFAGFGMFGCAFTISLFSQTVEFWREIKVIQQQFASQSP